jgi:hypothetical protein
LAELAHQTNLAADLADLTELTHQTDLATDLADLAELADQTNLPTDLADLADLPNQTKLTELTDLANLAAWWNAALGWIAVCSNVTALNRRQRKETNCSAANLGQHTDVLSAAANLPGLARQLLSLERLQFPRHHDRDHQPG